MEKAEKSQLIKTQINQFKMTISNASVVQKLLLLFLIFAGIYFSKGFLMPLCIAGILATLFLPFCNWMEAKKVPKWLAVITCLIALLLIIVGLITLVGVKVAELLNDVELIKQRFSEIVIQLQRYIFDHVGISLEKQSQILQQEQPSVKGIIENVAASVTYIFTNMAFVFVYFIFLLYYRTHLKIFILKLAKPANQSDVEHIINSAATVSQQYLLGLSKMIVCLWIMYGIGFSLLGVKSAMFFAILCGLLEVVPYVGNLTGSLLTVLVAALHGASPSVLGGIVIVYALVQVFQGWVLEPLILGAQVKINGLLTIMSLVLGQLLWGIPGIVLAIPITAVFKIVCDHIDQLKPYGFLIGSIKKNKAEQSF